MKTSLLRTLVPVTAFVFSVQQAAAHPGHDGHELTWDFGHLAQHPFATIGCAAIAGAIVAMLIQALRRKPSEPAQSFRGSQPSRGK